MSCCSRRRAVFVALSAGLALALLTLWVLLGSIEGIDRRILSSIDVLRSPGADTVFRLGTRLGSVYLLGPVALVATLVLAVYGFRRDAWMLALGFYGSTWPACMLKILIQRSRPEIIEGLQYSMPASSAFPSGHTTNAAAMALCLASILGRHKSGLRPAVAFVFSSAVGGVALSRIYLHVHWPSDVVAGLLVALMWTKAVYAAVYAHQQDRESDP